MSRSTIELATIGGLVAFVGGVVGEIIWYGWEFEMLMWIGALMVAAMGIYQLWGKK